MTLNPYKPVPWESFTLIPTPKQRRASKAARIFLTLCAMAIAAGVLIALSH